MIKDIESGLINCVITKDLSRLGRNYLDCGLYLEVFFPEHNVRYIAVNDGVDTLNKSAMDITPWEPTDNTSTENSVLSLMMIDDLINEVSLKYPEAKAVFSLLMDDPQISNALKQVDLKKGKSQAYEYVKKMQAYAKELYNKNYR